jgi:hypothetical protein
MRLRYNLIALRLNFTEEQGLSSPVASSTRRIAISYFESSCGGEQYNQWIRPHTNLSWGKCWSGKTHTKLPMAPSFESEFIEPGDSCCEQPNHPAIRITPDKHRPRNMRITIGGAPSHLSSVECRRKRVLVSQEETSFSSASPSPDPSAA